MILVRLVFQAKFGHAADVVAEFKRSTDAFRNAGLHAGRVRVLTDLSGPFDTVVQEIEYDNYESFAADQQAMFSNPQLQEGMAGSRDLFTGGYKEFYTIEFDR